jgi:hypothetical protein
MMPTIQLIWNVTSDEPEPQVTVAVAVPGVVLEPVCQPHLTVPEPSAVAGPRPCDWLCAPLGNVTESVQATPGEASAISMA